MLLGVILVAGGFVAVPPLIVPMPPSLEFPTHRHEDDDEEGDRHAQSERPAIPSISVPASGPCKGDCDGEGLIRNR